MELVKYKTIIEEGEETLVMQVLEDRCERLLVMDLNDKNPIPATWNVKTNEVISYNYLGA